MHISRPSNHEVKHLSKGELADQLLPNETYDTALPQQWVNGCLERGFDPRPHIVWLYKEPYTVFGTPFALTVEAHTALQSIIHADNGKQNQPSIAS
jgi:hypothetical protein